MVPSALPQTIEVTQQEENISTTRTIPPITTEVKQQATVKPTIAQESDEPSPAVSIQRQGSLYPVIVPSLVGLDFPVREPWTLSALYGTNHLVMEFNGSPVVFIVTGERATYANIDDLIEIIRAILKEGHIPDWEESPAVLSEGNVAEAIGQLMVQKVMLKRDDGSFDIIFLGEQESRFVLLWVPALYAENEWSTLNEKLYTTHDEYLAAAQRFLDMFMETIQFQEVSPIPELQPGVEYTDQTWSSGPRRNYYHYIGATQHQVQISVTPIDGFREFPRIQVWETPDILNWPVEKSIDLANPDIVSIEQDADLVTTLSFTAKGNQTYLIGIIDSARDPIFDITYSIALSIDE